MILKLKRYAYLPERTLGRLYFGEDMVYTIERPWIPTEEHLGGKNFESCVPDGVYSLQPFDSDNHHNVWILESTSLDVFKFPSDKPGRWAILIHVGNYVDDVVGCIAPGLTTDGKNVYNSRKAMDKMREVLKKDNHELVIEPKGATNEKPW